MPMFVGFASDGMQRIGTKWNLRLLCCFYGDVDLEVGLGGGGVTMYMYIYIYVSPDIGLNNSFSLELIEFVIKSESSLVINDNGSGACSWSILNAAMIDI